MYQFITYLNFSLKRLCLDAVFFSGPYHVCQAIEINFLLLLSGRFENFYTSYICLFILFFNRQYYQFFYITCDSRKMHDFINFHSFFLFILSTEMSIAKHYTKL